jgi:hypothetical protein
MIILLNTASKQCVFDLPLASVARADSAQFQKLGVAGRNLSTTPTHMIAKSKVVHAEKINVYEFWLKGLLHSVNISTLAASVRWNKVSKEIKGEFFALVFKGFRALQHDDTLVHNIVNKWKLRLFLVVLLYPYFPHFTAFSDIFVRNTYSRWQEPQMPLQRS